MQRSLIFLLASLTLLSGCETAAHKSSQSASSSVINAYEFTSANYTATAELMKNYRPFANVDSAAPFIVTTPVNIDQIDKSSTLGRLIAEQISTRLTQLGYGVVEMKVRNSVYMKNNEGEFLLTRELKNLSLSHKAQAVLVGTYAESNRSVFVNLKVIDPESGLIRSAYDYSFEKDQQIQSLLRTNRF